MFGLTRLFASAENEPADKVATASPSVAFMVSLAIGLACARISTLALQSESSMVAVNNLMSGGTGIIKGCVFLALALVLYARPDISQKVENNVFRVLIIIVIVVFPLNMFLQDYVPGATSTLVIAKALGSIASTATMFYWLVKARNMNPKQILIFVILARVLSEVFSIMLAYVVPIAVCLLGVLAVAAQVCCFSYGRRKHPNAIPAPSSESSIWHFNGIENRFKEQRFLTLCILTCILLSLSIGLLSGYPLNSFSAEGNAAACLIVIVLCLLGILVERRSTPLILVAMTWSVMQILGIVSVASFTFLPAEPIYGSALALAFDSMMGVFKWYLSIALMNLGKKNPYYYAILLYLIFLLPRDLASWALGVSSTYTSADLSIILAATAIILVVSGQGIFIELVAILTETRERVSLSGSILFDKVLGLNQLGTPEDIRMESMKMSAKLLGDRFSLSDREVEVLALFASGYTQNRVAEELNIAASTSHAHIRHIYDKTGLHSRQEILDYISSIEDTE